MSNYRQNVAVRLSEMSAATASIMTTTFTAASEGQTPSEWQSSTVNDAVGVISHHMSPLCDDVNALLLLMDAQPADDPDGEKRENLLTAAKRLAVAFNEMFQAAHPNNVEVRGHFYFSFFLFIMMILNGRSESTFVVKRFISDLFSHLLYQFPPLEHFNNLNLLLPCSLDSSC